MKEIEIKARLRDKDLIIEKLESLGCVFSNIVSQEDIVYVKEIGSLETFLANSVFLRVRVNNNSRIIFTAKKRTAALVAIEHEVGIDSKEEMKSILALMGYREAVHIKKNRITTQYNGDEICIDEVEGLGSFIEMERLTKEGDAQQIQEELFRFFLSLGISLEDRITKGYDVLMLEKQRF